MADLTRSYDPSLVILNFCGLNMSEGMADGDFFTAEPASESHTSVSGADGSAAYAVNLDRRANAKINTLATSVTNGLMHALHATGTVGPFEMRDLNGSLIVEAPKAKIKKYPSVARGKEVGSVEWEIELFETRWTHAAAAAV